MWDQNANEQIQRYMRNSFYKGRYVFTGLRMRIDVLCQATKLFQLRAIFKIVSIYII